MTPMRSTVTEPHDGRRVVEALDKLLRLIGGSTGVLPRLTTLVRAGYRVRRVTDKDPADNQYSYCFRRQRRSCWQRPRLLPSACLSMEEYGSSVLPITRRQTA